MKNDVSSMTLPKIKRMLRLRIYIMVLSVLFSVLTVAFLFGKQVLHWPWSGSFLVAAVCLTLVVACFGGFLFLNNKLARSGL